MKNPWDSSFRYIVVVALLVLMALIIWYIRDIFQPLITAGLIAYLLSPLVNLLSRRAKLKRKAAANIVFFVVMAIFIALPFTVLPSVLDEVQSFMKDFNSNLDQLQTVLIQTRYIGGVPVYLGSLIPTVRTTVSSAIIPLPEQAIQFVQTTSRGFLWFLMIVVTTYNLMTEWDKLREWLISLAPDSYQQDLRQLYQEMRGVWLSYLGGQIRLVLVLAVMYAVAWSIIGLPGAIWLGLLAGMLNMIPEIGPLTAAVVATVVAVLEGSNFLPISNLWFGALTLSVYLIINNFKTIYLQPRILGKSVLLPEGVVFIAIIAAIVLQGVLAVLVVVPVLASGMVLGRYVRRRLLGLPPFEDTAPQEPDSP